MSFDSLDKTNTIDTSYYLSMPEWNLIGNKVTKYLRFYPSAPEPYDHMIFSLKLKREPQFFFVKCILPFVVFSSLSCFIFLLPPDNGERISLGINIMLGDTIMSAMVADSMPSSSDTIPRISLYFLTIFVSDAVCLIANVWIINIQAKRHPVPRWVRIIILKGLAVLVCLRYKTESYSASMMYMIPDIAAPSTVGESSKNRVNGGPKGSAKLPHVQDLLNEVKCITRKIHKAETADKIREDWMFIARVLDRVAFVMFVVSMTTATLIMFLVSHGEG